MQARVDLLRRFRGEFDLSQNYVYGVFDREETEVLGGTGLHPRGGPGALEIGYWIHVAHINQGLATELSAALTKVAFCLHQVDRVEIHCDPHNVYSTAVPRKLGYLHEATLHKRLTGAVEHLVSGEDWSRALAFAAQFRARSFSNTLLIWDQHQGAYEQGRVPGPFPSYVAGYKQWQTLGRQVEKGQPGYQILAPVTGRFASANPADAESWRRLGKGEKPRAGEVVRSKMVGVRPA